MSIFEEYGAFNTTKLQKGSAAVTETQYLLKHQVKNWNL